MSARPYCQTVLPWLRSNLGRQCLAPLTSTDAAALSAAVQIVLLYAHTGGPQVLNAFGTVVQTMQRSTWELAYHAIAHILDWDDRGRVWNLAGLPTITVRKCNWEPGGVGRRAA